MKSAELRRALLTFVALPAFAVALAACGHSDERAGSDAQSSIPTAASGGDATAQGKKKPQKKAPYDGYPVALSIAPNSGPVDVPTRVTITGVNFKKNTEIFIGGVELQNLKVVNDTKITGQTPCPEGCAAAGVPQVFAGDPVRGSWPGLVDGGNPPTFTYRTSLPPLSLTSVSPAAARPGAVLTITGSGFRRGLGTGVRFVQESTGYDFGLAEGAIPPHFEIVNDTTIIVQTRPSYLVPRGNNILTVVPNGAYTISVDDKDRRSPTVLAVTFLP